MTNQPIIELQAKAMGRSRKQAAEVLIPHILAAADRYGNPRYDASSGGVRSIAWRGRLEIRTEDRGLFTYFQVAWRGKRTMEGYVCRKPMGTYADGWAEVTFWDRREPYGWWQTDLFDTFDLTDYHASTRVLDRMDPRYAVDELLRTYYPSRRLAQRRRAWGVDW